MFYQKQHPIFDSRGFTLLELLFVIVILGILSAIAAPTGLQFIQKQRLNTAQNQAYLAIRTARQQAQKNKATWQVSFRENNGIVEWTTHSANILPASTQWNQIDSSIQIDPETTALSKSGARIFRFDFKGHTIPPLGRITLSSRNNSKDKRCIFVSTLLGTTRTAKEQNQPKDGRYCY